MALDRQNLVQLMKIVAKAEPGVSTTYSWNNEQLSYDALNEVLHNEFSELAGTYSLYRENKNTIFSIIEEVVQDILPARLSAQYDRFAEIKSFAQGDKPLFKRKLTNRNRAKQFITRVGLAGVYETFKLSKGTESFEVPTSAIGGAAQIGFEEFLDGRIDFAEVVDIIMEGMDELIYDEIAEALSTATSQLPSVNVETQNSFDEVVFDTLLAKASAYGTPVIYCTNEFAVKMVPKEGWRYTEAMKDELYRTGRLANYKGYNVVILPQGFKDIDMKEKTMDPSKCWIIPAGADTKPIKVALEGDTIVDEYVNRDRSREIQVYKKVGVVAMMTNNIFCYTDESLTQSRGTLTFNYTNPVTYPVEVTNEVTTKTAGE